ncbi:MAG: NAD(P)-dependent oxidoreductase [Bdellovibrionota bacterium]
MAENILIIGKNSYAGAKFTKYAQEHFDGQVIAASSAECDLLDAEASQVFFQRLPQAPFSVVNFAVINKSVENTYQSFLDNMTLVRNLASGLSFLSLTSLVHLSSVDVYGASPQLPVSETSSIAPDTWYGLAKYNSEWVLEHSPNVSCPRVMLRIPGIYGKGANDRSVIGRLAASAKNGRIVLSGGGEALRDYLWVEDLNRIIAQMIRARAVGTFNVATGASVPLKQVAELLCSCLRLSPEISETAKSERDFDLRFDISKLHAALPEFQFTSLRQALADYSEP